MNNRFFVIGLGNDNNAIKEMYYEVINNEIENSFYFEPIIFKNKLEKIIYKIVFSRKYRKYFKWLPNSIWSKRHVLSTIKIDKNYNNYFIMNYGTDIDRLHYSKIISKLKEKNPQNVKFVLMLFDPVESPLNSQGWNRIMDISKEFDIVATFDENDAKRYNFLYFRDFYSKRKIKETNLIENTDLYFIGADKGRGNLLHKIAIQAKKNNIKAKIMVNGLNKNIEVENILTSEQNYLSYDQMLSYIDKTNCILEVLCDGQSSSSLRYYEAIVYNKKLLTNNKNITKMPYYNDKFIKIFQKPEDIDYNWISKKEHVDYNYKGDFSIKLFFEKISKMGE